MASRDRAPIEPRRSQEDLPVPETYRFHHLALIAKNFDQTVDWYKRHFGFTVAREWAIPAMMPGTRMCYLQRGSFYFEIIGDGEKVGHHLVAEDPLQDYQITGFRHFAFEVDDVDAAIASLAAEGVPTFFPPTDFEAVGIRAALVRDPEGNTIELIKWL
jgi:glyoxylase I family protein